MREYIDEHISKSTIVPLKVVARLPIAPIWSLLFFIMLLTLGLDSQFALMETVTTAILDGLPTLRNYKIWVVLGAAVIGYAGGVVFTTNASYILNLKRNINSHQFNVFLAGIKNCFFFVFLF